MVDKGERPVQRREMPFPVFPKQALLLTSKATEVLWGGAAGPGKSHGSRIAAIAWAAAIPGLQIYLFRREFNDLIKNHMEGPTGFRALLQPLVEMKRVIIREKEIEFVQEHSKIFLCHCQYENDVYGYQGAEIHVLILEEASQFTDFMMTYLRSRVRMPDVMTARIPDQFLLPPEMQTDTRRHCFPRIVLPTNPGGVGHQYLRKYFVNEAKKRTQTKNLEDAIWIAPDDEGGFIRQFIPAKLSDNPAVNPVEYAKRLQGLGSPQLVRALLEGDWDAVVGAFFPECEYEKHVIESLTRQGTAEVPGHWFKFRTFDWGSSAPASVLWWCVADGDGAYLDVPRGSLICYREWYIAREDDQRKGLGLSNIQMAEGILSRTPVSERVQLTICDNKPFQATGGKTIAEEMERAGVVLTQGDTRRNSRHQGWQQLRSRLIGVLREGEKEDPTIYFTKDCPMAWRHLCEIQTDDHDPEDVDTAGLDHDVDAISLACKARPQTRDLQKDEDRPVVVRNDFTFNQAVARIQKYKRLQDGHW